MDRVCEVDYGGALRQRDNVALRSEHEGLVIEDIVLQRIHELIVIDRVVFGIDKLRYPFKLLIYLFAAALAGFIFPMRGYTVFGDMVHFLCSDLHLERDSVAADNGRMERLIHIRLRCRNIILKASRDGFEKLVDYSESGITFYLVVNDYAQGVEVVYLVKAFVLVEHLPIDRIYGLYATLESIVDLIFVKLFGYI